MKLRIPRRFNGPPNSGNGGYSAGVFASALVPGPAEVTLRTPPPLDRDLHAAEGDAGAMSILDGEVLVAEVRRFVGGMEVPARPDTAAVRDATPESTVLVDHPFPTCFVCGPARDPGDGLRLFVGPVAGTSLYGAVWRPHPLLAAAGSLPAELVWAGLDCPGGTAVMAHHWPGATAVLGRMATSIEADVPIGQEYLVLAWPDAAEGRKATVGTALCDLDGRVLARAYATWIRLGD